MSHASWSVVNLLEYGQGFMSCTWHYLLIPLGGTGLFNPLRPYTWKCTLVYAVSLKNVLTVQFIMHESGHNMVIGNCHSRTSRTWQYLLSSQVLYGCILTVWTPTFHLIIGTGMLPLLLSCIWSVLDTLKVMLSHTYWHIMAFLIQLNIFSFYLETI